MNIMATSLSIYKHSILTNKQRYIEFLKGFKKSSIKKLLKDPGYAYWKQKITIFQEQILPKQRSFMAKMNELLKIYVEGKEVMFPEDKQWPDANSTLRVSYGKIEGSAPFDGMQYIEHTTTDGIIQKHLTGNPDFECGLILDKKAKAAVYYAGNMKQCDMVIKVPGTKNQIAVIKNDDGSYRLEYVAS